MNTELLSIIQHFMLHTNDAILRLYLNNQSYTTSQHGQHVQQETSSNKIYDNTQENTRETYQQLKQHLNNCQTQLETKVGKTIAEQMIVIIAIYADETILTSGLYTNGYLWQKLQTAYIGQKNGGNVFFKQINDLLASPDDETPIIMVELYHYCLTHDFKGRFYNNQQAISYYTKQLATRIEQQTNKKTTANKATAQQNAMRTPYEVA